MCLYAGRSGNFNSGGSEIIKHRNGVFYVNVNFIAIMLGFSSTQSLLRWAAETTQNEDESNNGTPTSPNTDDGTSTKPSSFKRTSE